MLVRLRKFAATVAVVLLPAMFIVACDSDDSVEGFGAAAFGSDVRILHAVADAPLVNVYVNDNLVLGGVDFRVASGFLRLAAGSADIRVEAILPGGGLDVIDADNFPLPAGAKRTVIAVGTTAPLAIEPLVVVNPAGDVTAGNARLQVTHAAAGVGEVYLAVTSPGFPIDQADYLGPIDFKDSTTSNGIEVPAGQYQVRVLVGTPSPSFSDSDVVFDSGEITLPDGADLQAVAVNSTVPSQAAPNGSPISVVLLDANGSSDLFDVNVGADLRVVHNYKPADPVDVIVDVVDTPADENLKIVTNLAFGEATPYLEPAVAPVAYDVSVVLNSNNSVEALNFVADLMPGLAYTVIANDEGGSIGERVLVDDYRRVATEAKLRVFHGSPAAGTVDVYVIPDADNLLPADTDPALPGFTVGTDTGFIPLTPGIYDVYITAPNGDTPVISVPDLPLDGSGIYTVIARDPVTGTTPGLILLDDLAP